MAYNPKDYFFKKAKAENYVARSVFKIQEIDERFKIFKPGFKVLDLGAAPGSWSQYASQKVGKTGRVLGIDIQPIKLTMTNSVFVTADMRDLDLAKTMEEHGIARPSTSFSPTWPRKPPASVSRTRRAHSSSASLRSLRPIGS